MKTIITAIAALLLLPFITSCNLFQSLPRGRENPEDIAAQITAFQALGTGPDTIVTSWNWKEPPGWVNDERILEINIQHSVLGYPENYTSFLGESFTEKSVWQFEWKGLDPDLTHYFSLFAKSTDGNGNETWYAPIKIKAVTGGLLQSGVFGFIQSLQVGDSGSPYIQSLTSSINIDNSAGPFAVLVIGLDLPDNIYVTSATIETGSTGGMETTSQIMVFPVTGFWDNNPDSSEGYPMLYDPTRDDYAVDDSISSIISNVNSTVNDVTEVVRKALLFNRKQIVFKIDGSGGSSINVYSTSFVTVEYYQN